MYLEATIAAIVGPLFARMGFELMCVGVLGRELLSLRIMVDHADGAGIGCPLTRAKGRTRFSGHLAGAETAAPIDRRKRFSGSKVALPLADIRRAKLVLTDALIAATATPPRTN